MIGVEPDPGVAVSATSTAVRVPVVRRGVRLGDGRGVSGCWTDRRTDVVGVACAVTVDASAPGETRQVPADEAEESGLICQVSESPCEAPGVGTATHSWATAGTAHAALSAMATASERRMGRRRPAIFVGRPCIEKAIGVLEDDL